MGDVSTETLDARFAPVSRDFVADLKEKADKAKSAVVYVSNCSNAVGINELRELFGTIGPIAGVLRGGHYYRLEFEQPEHAQTALHLDGTNLIDKCIKITTVIPPAPMNLQEVTAQLSTMTSAIPGLSDIGVIGSVTSPALTNAQLGDNPELKNIDPEALSKIQNTAAAINAQLFAPGTVQQMQNAHLTKQQEIARTIYVGNLHPAITLDQLTQFFSFCGVVSHAKLANLNNVGPNPTSTYGFIEFADLESAQKALSITGTMLGDRPMKINQAKSGITKPRSHTMVTTAVPNQVVANGVVVNGTIANRNNASTSPSGGYTAPTLETQKQQSQTPSHIGPTPNKKGLLWSTDSSSFSSSSSDSDSSSSSDSDYRRRRRRRRSSDRRRRRDRRRRSRSRGKYSRGSRKKHSSRRGSRSRSGSRGRREEAEYRERRSRNDSENHNSRDSKDVRRERRRTRRRSRSRDRKRRHSSRDRHRRRGRSPSPTSTGDHHDSIKKNKTRHKQSQNEKE